ncbi:MAG: Gfo/Idh/MocA family oxidoreductase [Acidobacteriota bacterium]|nr:Gfo/Idh/MocA family oxidoreductase [Acidobacteriota bacterium]
MSKRNRTRVGLVGVGNWAQYGHIPALRLLPEYEITAVSSRSLSKAQDIASRFAIPHAFGEMQQLVSHAEVDLVAVLSPAPEHASVVKAAILAGKDVFCEWPLTTSSKDSEELLLLAERSGVRHLVGLQRTVGASSLHLRDLISSGYVGRLRSVRMHVSMAGFGPLRSTSLEWTLPAKNFSHVLSIYGGHFMDMLFHAVGKPARLTALVKTQFPELTLEAGLSFRNETPDGVMVMGVLQDGAIFQIQLEGGKLNQTGLQIDITGTDGDLQVLNEKSFVTKHEDVIKGAQGGGSGWTELAIPDRFHLIPPSSLDVSVQDLAQLYASFARDRRDGTKTSRDFSDALAMHRLIDDIQQASATEQYVTANEDQSWSR